MKSHSATSRASKRSQGFEFAGERGRRRDDLGPGLRVVGFGRRVAITFAVFDDELTILRLYYGGQDWSR
jgi:toxin ParE1/3/4